MSLERTMITFNQGNECFNFRIAGIAIDNNHILLHRAAGETFWTCPGGRAEIGETTSQTLIREIKEELNEDIEVVRLLWVVENFFEYAQKDYHEIAFYFLMKLPERSPYLVKEKSFSSVEENTALEFKWFPIDSDVLTGLPLLPSFLQQSVSNLPNSVERVVERA
jgi:ADP-ribose pyrophosphatase YjhB (NUDIX family)